MFCQPIKPPKALQLFSQSCQEKDVGNTMPERECNPYSARFPELRLVFADAREAYTGLGSNTPFGGMQEGNIMCFMSVACNSRPTSGPGPFPGLIYPLRRCALRTSLNQRIAYAISCGKKISKERQ